MTRRKSRVEKGLQKMYQTAVHCFSYTEVVQKKIQMKGCGSESWVRKEGKGFLWRTREGSTAETTGVQALPFLCVFVQSCFHFFCRREIFLDFFCILGIKTGCVRLQTSGLHYCVLLHPLLMEKFHKLWQIQHVAVMMMMMVLGIMMVSLFLTL